METEGLRYVGGYIAKMFPQYQFLESDVGKEDTWIGFISRKPGKLKNPSLDFFEQLKLMEQLFKCYHGEKKLKSWKT